MSFWAEIIGQNNAVQTLDRAAAEQKTDELAHAWLITGPPGSGTVDIALRFAAALIAQTQHDRDAIWPLVEQRTHPDLAVLATQNSFFRVQDARDFVSKAHYAPTQGRHRVMVIEDAARLRDDAANTMLKAIEEPPERTIWILCAASEADLLPTIRSRARSVRLATPAINDVAHFLCASTVCDPLRAEQAARLAQGNLDVARRLATDDEALARRTRTLLLALRVQSLGDGMRAAAELLAVAKADGEALTEQLNAVERENMLRNLGVAPGAAVPPRIRSQLRDLDDDHERRKKRSLRDGIDRILNDLLTLYRDVLLTALGSGSDLVNREQADDINELATQWGAARALEVYTLVETARVRVSRAITPGLVLEALFAGIASKCANGRGAL